MSAYALSPCAQLHYSHRSLGRVETRLRKGDDRCRFTQCFFRLRDFFVESLQGMFWRSVVILTQTAVRRQTRRFYSSDGTKLVRFINGNRTFETQIDQTLLDVVVENDLALDGFGACEGTLACCTCHVILKKDHFEREDKLNPAGEEELDLLDMAPELSDYSRLGCQIKVREKDPDIIEVVVPTATRDARTT